MDKQFWIERWQENDIGFHQLEINPYLQTRWQQLSLIPNSQVFVPLCGKSKDLLWLVENGYQVLGVELSPLAVEDFFQENNLTPIIKKQAGFKSYSIDNLEILCGDFFSLTIEHMQTISAVFDRAALVALPPELREQYSQHLIKVLPAKTQILLINN